eukprot:Hpha_TRINITY_DN16596_c4_g2::TRINITY_DN16596_c4_g2_i2::g.136155::m.136155
MPNRREGGRGKGSTPVSVGVHGDESRGGRGRGLGKGAEGGGEAFAGTVWKQGPRLGSTPSPPPPEEDADYPPLGQVAQRSAAKQTSAPVPPPPAAGAGSNSPAQPPPPEPHSLFPPEPSQSPPPSSVYVEAKDPDDAQQLVMLLRQLGLVFMRPCKESGSGRPLNHFYAGFQQSEAVDVAVRALRGKGFVAAPSSIGADCWLDPRQKAFSPCVLLSNLPGSLSITDLDDMVQRHASVFLEVGSLGPYARPGETDTRYHVYVHFQNMRESETFLGDFHQFGFPRPVSATRSERRRPGAPTTRVVQVPPPVQAARTVAVAPMGSQACQQPPVRTEIPSPVLAGTPTGTPSPITPQGVPVAVRLISQGSGSEMLVRQGSGPEVLVRQGSGGVIHPVQQPNTAQQLQARLMQQQHGLAPQQHATQVLQSPQQVQKVVMQPQQQQPQQVSNVLQQQLMRQQQQHDHDARQMQSRIAELQHALLQQQTRRGVPTRQIQEKGAIRLGRKEQELEDAAQEVLHDLRTEGRLSNLNVVLQEISERYGKQIIQQEIYRVPALKDLSKLENSFNILAAAYTCVRSLGTLEDMERFAIHWFGLSGPDGRKPLTYKQPVETFADIGLGPICKQPVVLDSFQVEGLEQPPDFTVLQLFRAFNRAFNARMKRDGFLQLKDVEEAILKEEGKSASELCVWMNNRSFGHTITLMCGIKRDEREWVEAAVRRLRNERREQIPDEVQKALQQSDDFLRESLSKKSGDEANRVYHAIENAYERLQVRKMAPRDFVMLLHAHLQKVSGQVEPMMHPAVFSALALFARSYFMEKEGPGRCRSCHTTREGVMLICPTCSDQQQYVADSGMDPAQAEACRLLLQDTEMGAIRSIALRRAAEALGVPVISGMSKQDVFEAAVKKAEELVKERARKAADGGGARPAAALRPTGMAPQSVDQDGDSVRAEEVLQLCLKVVPELSVDPQDPFGVSIAKRLRDLEGEVCDQLQKREFGQLGKGSFAAFLCDCWAVQEDESLCGTLKELMDHVSRKPVRVEATDQAVMETMLKFLASKLGKALPSLSLLAQMERHTVQEFGAELWSEVLPHTTFMGFVRTNVRVFEANGWSFTITQGGASHEEEPPPPPGAELELFLADIRRREGQLNAARAEEAIAALFGRDTVQEVQRSEHGIEGLLKKAHGKSRMVEEVKSVRWITTAPQEPPVFPAELRESVEGIMEVLGGLCRKRPGVDVGDTLLWDLVYQPKHGPLVRWCAAHATELQERDIVVAICDEADHRGPRVLAANPGATSLSFSEACEEQDWAGAAGTLWSLTARGESASNLLVHFLSGALEKLDASSSEGGAAEVLAGVLAEIALGLPLSGFDSAWQEVIVPAATRSAPRWEEETASFIALHERADALGRRAFRGGMRHWLAAISENVARPRRRVVVSRSAPGAASTAPVPPTAQAPAVASEGVKKVESSSAGSKTRAEAPPPSEPRAEAPSTNEGVNEEEGEGQEEQRSVVERIRTEIGADVDRLEQADLQDIEDPKARQMVLQMQTVARSRGQNLHRATVQLAGSLYESVWHFFFELIQNADDNDYHPSCLRGEGGAAEPTVFISLKEKGVELLNNEKGFSERDIKALCKVGQSTKAGHESRIGRKGIGFKSVFAVTNTPFISSGGYYISFDSRYEGGMLIPDWVPEELARQVFRPASGQLLHQRVREQGHGQAPGPEQWTTMISIPFKTKSGEEEEEEEESVTDKYFQGCSRELQGMDPKILLFLRKLVRIMIQDQNTGERREFHKRRHPDPKVVTISNTACPRIGPPRTDSTDWRVLCYPLDVPEHVQRAAKDANKDHNKKRTEIQLAFRAPEVVAEDEEETDIYRVEPVMAYLPTQHSIFRFVVQADWNLTSSRAEVRKEDAWNEWLRLIIAKYIVRAFSEIKQWTVADEGQGEPAFPVDYLLGVMPLPEHDPARGQWTPVIEQVLREIKGLACIPTTCGGWAEPGQCLRVETQGIRDFFDLIGSEILYKACRLRLAHPRVSRHLHAARSLGVQPLRPRMVVMILRELDKLGELQHKDCTWFAKLFLALHAAFEVGDEESGEALRGLSIVPVQDGRKVATASVQVFFPSEGHASSLRYAFQRDITTIDPALLAAAPLQQTQLRMLLTNHLRVGHLSPSRVLDYLRTKVAPIFQPASESDGSPRGGPRKPLTSAEADTAVSAVLWLSDNKAEFKGSSLAAFKDTLALFPLLCTVDDGGDGESASEILDGLVPIEGSQKVLAWPSSVGVFLPPSLGGMDPRRFDVPALGRRFAWAMVDTESYTTAVGDRTQATAHDSHTALREFLFECGARPTAAHFVKTTAELTGEDPWVVAAQPPASFKSRWRVGDWKSETVERLLKYLLAPAQSGERARVFALVKLLKELAEGGAIDHLAADCTFFPLRPFDAAIPVEKDRVAWEEAPSSLALLLRDQSWVPEFGVAGRAGTGRPTKPSDLFFPTAQNLALLQDRVAYLSDGLSPREKILLRAVGAVEVLDVDRLLVEFQRWTLQPEFETSPKHMLWVYSALATKAGEVGHGRCIWSPSGMVTGGQPPKADEKLRGKWWTPDRCFFEGTLSVKTHLMYGREAAGHPDARFLDAYFYSALTEATKEYRDLFSAFLKTAGVERRPTPDVMVGVAELLAGQHIRESRNSIRKRDIGKVIIDEMRELFKIYAASEPEFDEADMEAGLDALWKARVWPAHDLTFVSPSEVRLLWDNDLLDDSVEIDMPREVAVFLGGGKIDKNRCSSDLSIGQLLEYTAKRAKSRGLTESDEVRLSAYCTVKPMHDRGVDVPPVWTACLAGVLFVAVDSAEHHIRSELDEEPDAMARVDARARVCFGPELRITPVHNLRISYVLKTDRDGASEEHELAENQQPVYFDEKSNELFVSLRLPLEEGELISIATEVAGVPATVFEVLCRSGSVPDTIMQSLRRVAAEGKRLATKLVDQGLVQRGKTNTGCLGTIMQALHSVAAARSSGLLGPIGLSWLGA